MADVLGNHIFVLSCITVDYSEMYGFTYRNGIMKRMNLIIVFNYND